MAVLVPGLALSACSGSPSSTASGTRIRTIATGILDAPSLRITQTTASNVQTIDFVAPEEAYIATDGYSPADNYFCGGRTAFKERNESAWHFDDLTRDHPLGPLDLAPLLYDLTVLDHARQDGGHYVIDYRGSPAIVTIISSNALIVDLPNFEQQPTIRLERANLTLVFPPAVGTLC